MEECSICCSVFSNLKELFCHHKLCNACYLKLDKPNCPFCRKTIEYTDEEVLQRNQNISNYYRWQPPLQLFTIERINNRNTRNNNQNNDNDPNIPFSRLERNRFRNRRRDLTKEEIYERRQNIRKRCRKKWKAKEGRRNKTQWFE